MSMSTYTPATERALVAAVSRTAGYGTVYRYTDARVTTLQRLVEVGLGKPVRAEEVRGAQVVPNVLLAVVLTPEGLRIARELAQVDHGSLMTEGAQEALISARRNLVGGEAVVTAHAAIATALVAAGYAERVALDGDQTQTQLNGSGWALADGLLAKQGGAGTDLPPGQWQTPTVPYRPMSTSQRRLHDTAGANGWTLVRRDGDSEQTRTIEYRRGDDYMRVSFAGRNQRLVRAALSTVSSCTHVDGAVAYLRRAEGARWNAA